MYCRRHTADDVDIYKCAFVGVRLFILVIAEALYENATRKLSALKSRALIRAIFSVHGAGAPERGSLLWVRGVTV